MNQKNEAPDNVARPAATVLLLRDTDQLEVLMVERHADIGFAGGALVFPGGKVDDADRAGKWSSCAAGLSQDSVFAAAQVAAIREAFEEAGVLLARRQGAGGVLPPEVVDGLQGWRKESETDAGAFFRMLEVEDLVLACDHLTLFSHWVPPMGLHKRFDTLFFLAPTPPGQVVRQDGVEATEAVWLSPQKALADAKKGARRIIFPTARNLELLGLSSSVENAIAASKSRTVRQIQPKVEERDGVMYLTIPDDLGYPVTEERLDAADRS